MRVGNRVELVENPSEEKFFEHCTNCAILPTPFSRDHFCKNLAPLPFHSSAGERLQFLQFACPLNTELENPRSNLVFDQPRLFINFIFGILYHSLRQTFGNSCTGNGNSANKIRHTGDNLTP